MPHNAEYQDPFVMNDARYPNISAIDNKLTELENEKQQPLALREALRSERLICPSRYSISIFLFDLI